MATATIAEKDFATMLDARIRHYQRIEAERAPKVIEQKVEKPKVEPPPTPKHPPTVPDRRFRRI
jgi:hypothetical protein